MTTKTSPPVFYSSMNNNDDQLFSDEQIQRYDADTIKHRYGENWRNYASNVREITQADGSIVREYIIEDPSLLNEIKTSVDSTSSTTGSDDEHQSPKNRFAQIKAKFEQRSLTNVMASPSSTSSVASSHTTTRRNSNRSNDSVLNNRTNSNIPLAPPPPPPPMSINTPQSTSHSQHSRSGTNSSFQRLNSADEADEEVRRIHRQGVELRQHQSTLTPISSIDETKPEQPPRSNSQYEVVDEDGNPMAIDDVHDLIKMSGVTAREVPQPDGTIIREYVIDDPTVLSKFQSQQQRNSHEHIPPPPPRIPLKQSALFRQEPLPNDHHQPPINIQQVRTLEPQRRYEFITTSGKRIEFMITNLGSDESDIHELANTLNTHRLSSSSSTNPVQQVPFTLPKQWHPAVDLTHREPSQTRQRTGSDSQPIPNNSNIAFQQIPPPPSMHTDLDRSGSYGGRNQGTYPQQFAPVFAEPIIDWSAVRQQDPHGQVDPQLIRQYITQKHQTGSFQTSAQFLPEQQQQQQQQMARSTTSPPKTNPPMYYQQTIPYPYQGQQQHGVRIQPMNNTDYNFHQQIANDHTRI